MKRIEAEELIENTLRRDLAGRFQGEQEAIAIEIYGGMSKGGVTFYVSVPSGHCAYDVSIRATCGNGDKEVVTAP